MGVMTRSARGAQTRTAIIDAALGLFDEVGYDATTQTAPVAAPAPAAAPAQVAVAPAPVPADETPEGAADAAETAETESSDKAES